MITLNEIFPYILAPVIVFSMQILITKFFEIRDKKKKKSIWIKFFRKTNESVNKCFTMFENVESSNGKWIEILRPLIPLLVYIFTLILFLLIFFIQKNEYISLALATIIISFFVLLLLITLLKYTAEKMRLGDVLNKSNEIIDFYTLIKWIFIGIISFIIPSLYSTIISNNVTTADLEKIRNMYIISIVFIIISIYIVIKFRSFFFNILKSEINTRYLKDFPIVHISTSKEILDGKISYIFDEDFIILDNDRVIKGTQWDEIIIISY